MLGSAWVIRKVPSRRVSQRRTGFEWGPLLAFLRKRNVRFFLLAILVSETANQMAYIFPLGALLFRQSLVAALPVSMLPRDHAHIHLRRGGDFHGCGGFPRHPFL